MLNWTHIDMGLGTMTPQNKAYLVPRSYFLKYNYPLKATRTPWKNNRLYFWDWASKESPWNIF